MNKNIKRILAARKIRKFFKTISDFINRKKIAEKLFNERLEFYSKIINPGDLVFDVGANIGNRVEVFLALGAKVIAIEPQEKCRKILMDRFWKSPDDLSRLYIVKKGLGAKPGMMELAISNSHQISSFSNEFITKMKDGRFKEMNWDKKVDVEIITLDDLIAEYGKPKFIKIDVEGFEYEVLSGLSKQIEYISFEYTTPEMLFNASLCFYKLKQIMPDCKFNWSIGESMKFADNWIDSEQMESLLASKRFIDTGFGDIYSKIN